METINVVCCVVMIAVAIVVGIYYALQMVLMIKKEKRASVRKTQIEIGKSVNDRFEEIERSLQWIENQLRIVQGCTDRVGANVDKLGKSANSKIDKNMSKIDKIEKSINEKIELLNKQPEEEKKDDNSPIWGILSGILSGALTSVLMNTNSEKKEETQSQSEENSNTIYGIRNKATGEILEQRYESALDAYRGLKENNLNFDDYDIGIIETKEENKPEETQE